MAGNWTGRYGQKFNQIGGNMAFLLPTSNDGGPPATFWMIGKVTENMLEGWSRVTLSGWTDHDSWKRGDAPVRHSTSSLEGEKYARDRKASDYYVIITAMPGFQDAVKVDGVHV